MGQVRLERLTARNEAAFWQIHDPALPHGECACTAWWFPTWDAFRAATPGDARDLRQRLHTDERHDGYLLFDGEVPVAWCQCGPRDRLEKVRAQFHLDADPGAWAITCWVVAPAYRRRGVCRSMLKLVLADLQTRGAKSVEAFPKQIDTSQPSPHGSLEADLWCGPESVYREAGFVAVGERVMRLGL